MYVKWIPINSSGCKSARYCVTMEPKSPPAEANCLYPYSWVFYLANNSGPAECIYTTFNVTIRESETGEGWNNYIE